MIGGSSACLLERSRASQLRTAAINTPGQVESLRPEVEQIVDVLIDAVETDGGVKRDRWSGLRPPGHRVCDLLSVPSSYVLFFRSLADRLLGFQGRNRPELESSSPSRSRIVADPGRYSHAEGGYDSAIASRNATTIADNLAGHPREVEIKCQVPRVSTSPERSRS